MVTPVAPHIERCEAGVADFLASFEWTYLAHYFSSQAQGRLLRLLTLSGLDTNCWKGYAMHLVSLMQLSHPVVKWLTQEEKTRDQVPLQQAVLEIWAYAASVEALASEPPYAPTYLTAFGYTQKAYLTDLHLVYGMPPDPSYEMPWPDTISLPTQSDRPLTFAHQAVARMGATAGALAQLVKGGMVDDEYDRETYEAKGESL
jgi:hypothetical protein